MTAGVVQKGLVASGLAALVGSHIGIGDFAFLLIAAAYILSIARDWRPVRQLREENRELRAELDQLQKKYDTLEDKCERLEKSRDFQQPFQELVRALDQARADTNNEHAKILLALEAHSDGEKDGWNELTKTLAAISNGVTALAAGINAGAIPVDSPPV